MVVVVSCAQSVNDVQSKQQLTPVNSACHIANSTFGLRSPGATQNKSGIEAARQNNNNNNGKMLPAQYQHQNKFSGWAMLCGLVLLAVTLPGAFARSCREASLCCNGRDSSCVVQKAPINTIIEDPINDKPCYCDHACLKLGDCCADFKQFCGVMDCQVSDWEPWTECDATCGTGIMTRNRTVVQVPQNGGKHCPSLTQKRGCQGFHCHHHRDRRLLRETALLLPASLSMNRRENDTIDIRRNLRIRYRDAFKHNRNNEYCVDFEVLKVSKACHKLPMYTKLAVGDRVTIRCDLEALQKDGHSSETDQTGINENTFGMEEDPSKNSVLDYQDDAGYTKESLKKRPLSKFRCRGEGAPGRNSRFGALASPSCHGKWVRLSLDRPKKCSEFQFIFI